jgi:hypothetical protein
LWLERAYVNGLINKDTVILGISKLSSASLWTEISDPQIAVEILLAVRMLVIAPAFKAWMMTPTGKAFVARFRSQPDTTTLMTSDSAHLPLYRRLARQINYKRRSTMMEAFTCITSRPLQRTTPARGSPSPKNSMRVAQI